MRVLVIRHAEAVPHGTRGVPDGDRPLTPAGERAFHAAARGLARLLPPPGVLLTSPLLRARQTAAVAATAWGGPEPTPESALASGNVDAIIATLERYPPDATVALVGHEPTVSALVAELLGLSSSDAIAFEPGAAALLEWASPARRSGRLVWFLPADAVGSLGGIGGSGLALPDDE